MADWKPQPGEWAAVQVDQILPDGTVVIRARSQKNGTQFLCLSALHPLPAASAEDAAVIQAAEAWVARLSPDTVDTARWAAPEAHRLITAVRARAARKAPAHPICGHPKLYDAGRCCGNTPCTVVETTAPVQGLPFKVGDRVRQKEGRGWEAYAGKEGVVIPQKPNSHSLWVRFSDGQERGYFANSLEPAPDVAAPVPADSPDPAAGEAHKLSALREAVVEAALEQQFCWDARGDYDSATAATDNAARAYRAAITPPDPLNPMEAENARMRKALASIANINNGPDQASATWRLQEVQAIALAALERKL